MCAPEVSFQGPALLMVAMASPASPPLEGPQPLAAAPASPTLAASTTVSASAVAALLLELPPLVLPVPA
jgi:hypothetical protein